MKFFISILLTLVLCSSSLFAQEVFVDMPQNQGYIGIPMKLVVVYQNVKTDREPSIPEIDGFSISRKPEIRDDIGGRKSRQLQMALKRGRGRKDGKD